MTQDEIFEKVRQQLVDALSVDEDEVTPQARLQADLNAESIDFLDIVFRLEREFGIKIDRNELFPESIFQGDPDFVQDGKVTAKGLGELKTRMPYAMQRQTTLAITAAVLMPANVSGIRTALVIIV